MQDSLIDWTDADYSIPKLLAQILVDTKDWKFSHRSATPWYRGQDVEDGPIPSLFRGNYDEFDLVTTFRNRANALKDTPETNRIDKWLFLMQHYGVPTRLLDWTESPLLALYFALHDSQPESNASLWILHSLQLNISSIGLDQFPNTWTRQWRVAAVRRRPNMTLGNACWGGDSIMD